MNFGLSFLLLLLLTFSLSTPLSIHFAQEAPSKNTLAPDVLIQVEDAKITTLDFLKMVLENPKYRPEAFLILRTLLMEKILAQDAQKYGVFVLEKEKDVYVKRERELLEKRLKIDFGGQTTLEVYLKSQGLTVKQFVLLTREKVTKQLTLEKLIRYLQMQEDRVEVLYIESSSKNKAEKIREKILAGSSFSKAARKYSKHTPSKKLGGKLPVLSKAELGDLSETVFALKPNELSKVLEYNKKYHLFKMLKFYPKSSKKFEKLNHKIFKDLEETGATSIEIDQWLFSALERSNPQIKNKLLIRSKFLENVTLTKGQGTLKKKK